MGVSLEPMKEAKTPEIRVVSQHKFQQNNLWHNIEYYCRHEEKLLIFIDISLNEYCK